MKTKLHPYFFLLFFATISACTTTQQPAEDTVAIKKERADQLDLSLDKLLSYQEQIDTIAKPVITTGSDFCESKLTRDLGAYIVNKHAFADEYLAPAEIRKIGNEMEVLWIVDYGVGKSTPLMVGDKLVSVSGRSVPADDDAMSTYREILREQKNNHHPLEVTVNRQGKIIDLSVPSMLACDYPVNVILNLLPNAFADGRQIAIHSGLIRFFDNPEDLQIILGHELAHNIKGHVKATAAGSLLGAVLDSAIGADYPVFSQIGATAFSPSRESEADYVGLYIAANANVDISNAERIWRTFGVETSGEKKSSLFDTHPPTPERFVALRAAVKEIEKKRANGEPLRPNN